MSLPTYKQVPAPAWSPNSTRYQVTYEGRDIGTVSRGRHRGVGGPGARHSHEVWAHTCWSAEGDGAHAGCFTNRTQAALFLTRRALGLGYGDRDPF